MGAQSLSESLDSGRHASLNQLTGTYAGNSKTWFDPGILGDESPINAKITPLLDGRFIKIEYHGSLSGSPMHGILTIGYNLVASRYEGCWIDTFHVGTTIMDLRGPKSAKLIALQGEYFVPEDGSTWGWAIDIISVPESDGLTITHYNITPSGERAKGVEWMLKKV